MHLQGSQGVMCLLCENLEGFSCLLSCELRLCLGAVVCYSLKSSFLSFNQGRKYLWFLSRKKCLQNLQKGFYHFTYSAWSTKPKRAQKRDAHAISQHYSH